jgi:predicted nucleic acid-binding protein
VIVLDTNVVSELMRPSPSRKVVDWVRSKPDSELFTTAITFAEVLYGINRLPDGRRKNLLAATAATIFTSFADHVLPFDADAATWYAELVATRDRLGLPIDGFDAQIAAICRQHNAALATRNLNDFEHTAVSLIDPWRTS